MVNIPIKKDIEDQQYKFPISNKKLLETLEKVPEKDLQDLEGIIIAQPRTNKDMNRYGRYDPNSRIILLFAHYTLEGGTMIVGPKEMNKEDFEKEILDETIFHEIGHHKGIKDFGDVSEYFATTYSIKVNPKLKNKYTQEHLKELVEEAGYFKRN